jgi:hypothetical protein
MQPSQQCQLLLLALLYHVLAIAAAGSHNEGRKRDGPIGSQHAPPSSRAGRSNHRGYQSNWDVAARSLPTVQNPGHLGTPVGQHIRPIQPVPLPHQGGGMHFVPIVANQVQPAHMNIHKSPSPPHQVQNVPSRPSGHHHGHIPSTSTSGSAAPSAFPQHVASGYGFQHYVNELTWKKEKLRLSERSKELFSPKTESDQDLGFVLDGSVEDRAMQSAKDLIDHHRLVQENYYRQHQSNKKQRERLYY